MSKLVARRLGAETPHAAVTPERTSVFSNSRDVSQPALKLPRGLRSNSKNKADGISFLNKLASASFAVSVFDPQYRGVLDRQKYGNEGSRQQERAKLQQMSDEVIECFIREIDRVLMPSGHLFLWTDKFHLCTGINAWFEKTSLKTVDLVTWNKMRIGMGYRTRRSSEYLVILQKAPLRAKGVWHRHDIPDVWDEKIQSKEPHAKPVAMQERLIEAVTNPGDIVLDPAAGSYSVMEAARAANRDFLGCDIRG